MKAAHSGDRDALLAYLKKDIPNCIYPYIDITVCGLEHPNIHVWYDTDDRGISLVVMQYYASIWVYTDRDDWDVQGVWELLQQTGVAMLSGKRDMIERLHALPDCRDRFHAEYGWVMKHPKTNPSLPLPSNLTVEDAAPEDAEEIARLMCQDDDFGGQYRVHDLAAQLADRMRTGLGVSWIVRNEKGEIIGHSAIFGQTDDIAVNSGLIVRNDYRDSDCFMLLWKQGIEGIRKTGRQGYGYLVEQKKGIQRLNALLKLEAVGEYGKLILR